MNINGEGIKVSWPTMKSNKKKLQREISLNAQKTSSIKIKDDVVDIIKVDFAPLQSNDAFIEEDDRVECKEEKTDD